MSQCVQYNLMCRRNYAQSILSYEKWCPDSWAKLMKTCWCGISFKLSNAAAFFYNMFSRVCFCWSLAIAISSLQLSYKITSFYWWYVEIYFMTCAHYLHCFFRLHYNLNNGRAIIYKWVLSSSSARPIMKWHCLRWRYFTNPSQIFHRASLR